VCIAGPDSYRDLPRLIEMVRSGGEKAINVQLSVDETYADIAPVRPAGTHSAFISIMRGCANLCSFCIVPYGVQPSIPLTMVVLFATLCYSKGGSNECRISVSG
jgi:tRNA A37 methylthiotransferase MiaB